MKPQVSTKKPDAFLITDKSNIKYLSNFSGSSGFMLIAKNTSSRTSEKLSEVLYLFTDSRYMEGAKSIIKKGVKLIDITRVWKSETLLRKSWQSLLKKHRIKILGVEESNLTMARFKKFKKISKGTKILFKDASGEIEKQREIKNKEEINLTIRSQKINEQVLTEIKKIIQNFLIGKSSEKFIKECPAYGESRLKLGNPPTAGALTEKYLAWKIKELSHKYGAQDVSFDPIVAFGAHTAIPHHLPTDTKLKPNDIILIDMGVKYKGYCSDMTRTLLPKNPSKKQKEIYNIVLKAQNEGIKKIKAGTTGEKADEFSRDIIKKAGYGDFYSHAGGHGIGLDIHEIPSVSEKYKGKIKVNSIITVEPGIYLPKEFGVRIEDMILITKNGNTNITKMPK